jgi:ribosomal protein L21E
MRQLKAYDEGDEVIVKVVSIDQDVHVETVDPNYQKITGTIKYERKSLVYYYTDDLYKYFHVGDYLTATVKKPSQAIFSIEDQLISFFVEDTRETMDTKESYMLATLIDEQKNYSAWLTESGVAIRVEGQSRYHHGDFAFISVKDYGKGKFYGLISGIIREDLSEELNEIFDEKSARHDCIRAFAESTVPPVYQRPEEDTVIFLAVFLLEIRVKTNDTGVGTQLRQTDEEGSGVNKHSC